MSVMDIKGLEGKTILRAWCLEMAIRSTGSDTSAFASEYVERLMWRAERLYEWALKGEEDSA